MKLPVKCSLALCAVLLAAALALLTASPLVARSARKPAFTMYVGGDDKKDNPFTAQEQTVDGRKWGILVANGKGVMGFSAGAGGFTPLQRARLVAERMGKLYKGGARFKRVDSYVVSKVNGATVLAIRPVPGSRKLAVLFTIDSSVDRLLNAHVKGKKATRAEIALYWRDILIKAIETTDT
jgi:hypothetical protein